MKSNKIETIAVHGGQKPDPVSKARGMSVCRTTAYVFDSAEHASNLFALKELGFIYSRLGDPTSQILETRLAQMEGGSAAVVTSSGTSAVHYTALTLARAGDEIVAASNLYGGTHTMFKILLPDQGITVKFADSNRPDSFRDQITSKTRFLFVETMGNPALDMPDISALAKIAHEHHIPLVVDSTFTPPTLYRPIEDGADIVIHSLSKWIGGHGAAMGGAIIDSGKFDWKNSNVPLFNEPDGNYHGIRWAHDLPTELAPQAFALRFRTVPLRNLGACLSPDNSWIFLIGCETLHLRMERHNENAFAVARFLKKHPEISWVRYPGFEGDPSYTVASKQLKKGFGGMVVFGIKAGKGKSATERGRKFIENLSLFSHVTNVGDTKSLATHPASTTHSQLTEEEQKATGLPPELIRLSIGIEHIDDIIADLEQALAN
ncbi:MAG TPA: O-acetylhomoserine aminocarboxypropyltransferase/cysteine synthase [Treponema sp.]|nr:O-acetylhomoserine aminocarboxypropyltransferase/cysteine synthase [Treponema sp.]